MTAAKNIFVATIKSSDVAKLRQDLEEQGFEFTTPPYTHFSAKKKGVSCTIYTSLKLTVQGKDMAQFIEFYLEPEILKTLVFTNPVHAEELDLTARIGVDESGKGDFFGPLCIAAVFAEGKQIERLKEFGVRDSKTLSDQQITKLASLIQQHYQHYIVTIGPLKYNEMYASFGNLNSLLAWGHATCIEKLSTLSNCKKVVLDQFAHEYVVEKALQRKKLEIDLLQKHRAEADPIVAAASILARNGFLEGMKKLEKECGMVLPRGASSKTIETGKALVAKFGEPVLQKVSKQHFRTTGLILQKE